MMTTLEATLDESGHIHFSEPVKIHGVRRVLVTLLDPQDDKDRAPSAPRKTLPARGAMKGMLTSVEEFIASKAAEIAVEEKP